MTDWELLRQYREKGSNSAFRELADRHMKLVYSTCRRDLGNAQTAEDATQLVFILLARKANAISRAGSVSSWLFGTARFVCKDIVKSEMRRRRREEAALGMEQARSGSEEWDEIEPRLNDAMTTLTPSDREAVLMRYYDGMSLQEIAGLIGTTEDTARKRVARAVDRLRRYFQREQATANLFSLDALLAAHAAGAVPQQTHSAVMSTLQNLGAAHGPEVTLHAHAGALLKKGAFVLMDATMKKVIGGLVMVAVIGAGIGIPIAFSHIHSERLASQEVGTVQDTGTFIDATTPVSGAQLTAYTAANRSQADKQAILAIVRKSLDDFCHRDLSHFTDSSAPDMVVTIPGRPDMSTQGLKQQEEQVFQIVGPFHMTNTVQSLKVDGDTAEMVLSTHFDGKTIRYQQAPPGIDVTSDETQHQVWRKENGRWLTTRIDITSLRTANNGQVVLQVPPANQSAER